MKQKLIAPFCAFALGAISITRAEEAGTGHYMPGVTASFIDMVPGYEAFACMNIFTYYNGDVRGGGRLEIGGQSVAGIDATVYADTPLFLYQTPWKILGGQYAAAVAIPYMWMEVEGTVQVGQRTGKQRDTASGIGDVQIFPLMLSWTNGDLKLGGNFSVYAPTGDFEKGHLANIGRNYWTFEPGVNASWLSSKIGLELTAFAGFDFSTENEKTHYQSGDVFHLDATVAEHVPLGKLGFIGVGANAFYYQQISGDSGSGAVLGDFEGRTVGVGPVLSFIKLMGKKALAAEVKWLPELDVDKRLKGDIVWFKLALSF
jgi:hypothetical protein